MAAIAQLGERQTEDLKAPGSIPVLAKLIPLAALAQLGERQTEDLKAPCSIHGGGTLIFFNVFY